MEVDPKRRKETPSAETTPPGNHILPGNPGRMFRPHTGPGDPGPGLHTGIDGVPDADGDPGTHGGPDGETHRRAYSAYSDAGQSSDPRTNSNSGTPGGTRSLAVTGLRGNALRTI